VQAQGSNVDRQGNDVDGNQSAGRLLPNADVITGVGCVLPQWLESESQRLDDIVVRLHKRQGLDLAGYQKESPADCPLQRFKYRVNVLGQLVAYMEKR
jgi:hypothetical protein